MLKLNAVRKCTASLKSFIITLNQLNYGSVSLVISMQSAVIAGLGYLYEYECRSRKRYNCCVAEEANMSTGSLFAEELTVKITSVKNRFCNDAGAVLWIVIS